MKRTFILLVSAAISSISIAQIPNYVPQSGLAVYYPFSGDGDLSEAVGTGLDGDTIANYLTMTTDRNGNSNEAWEFSGGGNISIQDNPVFSPSSELSISLWFKAYDYSDNGSSNTTGQRILISKRPAAGWGPGFQVKLGRSNDNYRRIGVDYSFDDPNNPGSIINRHLWYTENVDVFNSTPSVLTDNEWHHLVYTHSSTESKVYLNGILVASESVPHSIGVSAENVSIGSRPNGTHPFNGAIDELGFWSRILTQSEITDLYNGGTASVDYGEESEITLYPNPAKNTIFLNTEETVNVQIMGITGDLHFSGDIIGAEGVDVSSYTAGVYLVTLKSKDSTEVIKLIKE